MATQKDKEYESALLQWREKKYDALVRENGWLALAGLHWLKEGRNLIGSNPMCEVTLPERAPTFLGIVEWNGKLARFQVAEGVRVEINGHLAQKSILHPSRDPKPSFITWKNIRMVLHQHVNRSAIRVWDNEREERRSQPPLKWFPINKKFRISARYTRLPETQYIEQPDAFGELVEDRVDGLVTFRFEGTTYKLNASETDDHKLFIKFRDETSQKETYPPCRYYYTEPVENGKVLLDFNYAYNPPCAFTPFATCIFASAQNTLPFRIEAGEIYRG